MKNLRMGQKSLSCILTEFTIIFICFISIFSILSCGAGVNVGEADKVLTSFRIEWEEGFDYTCRSNEPVEVAIYALDQNDAVFDWSETISISLTNANLTVSPSAIEVKHGSGIQSIAIFNGTGVNQDAYFKVYYGSVSKQDNTQLRVYETIPPSDVDNFELVVWDGQIKLMWQNPPEIDFTGVRLVRRENGQPTNAEDGTVVYEGNSEVYIDKNLINYNTYYYSAFSYDMFQNYSNGVGRNGIPEDHIVNNITSLPGDHKITLFWEQDTDADYFNIYYTDDDTTPGSENGEKIEAITATTYEFDTLSNFAEYRFALTALKAGMESPDSGILLVVPPGKIVDAGYGHSIALKKDGRVWTWGRNDYGQLGNGDSPSNRGKPVNVLVEAGGEALKNIVSISAGYHHAVALKDDGTVWTWGLNSNGQLGDGDTVFFSDKPIQVLGYEGIGVLTGIVSIAAGYEHTVALRDDGTVWAWGLNSSGQLGVGDTVYRSFTPEQVLGLGGEETLSNVTAIDAGERHTAAVLEDGTVLMWGNNYYGQLGNGYHGITQSYTPTQVVGYGGDGILTGIVDITAGSDHTVALKNDGTVWAWGRNNSGQLGDNTGIPGTNRDTPVQVTGIDGVNVLTDVLAIGASGYADRSFTVAIKKDGTVWAWGDNAYGQLGNGENPNGSNTPTQVLGYEGQGVLAGCVALAAGRHHVLALKEDGSVWTWGYNLYGQLGDGGNTTQYTPITLTSAVEISAGSKHSAALLDDGTLRTWGYNAYGQLGDGTTDDSQTPVTVTTDGVSQLTNVSAVSCAGLDFFSLVCHYTVALLEDGTLRAWGQNTYGQLGDGTTDDSQTPVTVTTDGVNPLTNVVSISAENCHTLALLGDGSVKAWGRNFNGQLGNSTKVDSSLPLTVVWDHDVNQLTNPVPLTNIVKIATGSGHSVALLDDGTVKTWGNNDAGQLCDGSVDEKLLPVTVVWDHDDDPLTNPVALTNVASVAAGFMHTVFLLSDGTLKASSYDDPYLPITVTIDGITPLTGFEAIDTGSGHLVALLDTGTVMAGGGNYYGQLGDGTTNDRDYPVFVLADEMRQLTGVVGVSAGAGGNHTLFLLNDGRVVACGLNNFGQLGDSTLMDRHFPVTSHIYNLGWSR